MIPAAQQAISESKIELQRGNRAGARAAAQRALVLDPDLEEGWLLLAVIASPRASIAYLNRALEINPTSVRARKGMHWAIERQRKLYPHTTAAVQATQPIQIKPISRRNSHSIYVLTAVILLLCTVVSAWLMIPTLQPVLGYNLTSPRSIAALVKPTLTPTPTATFTPTPTFTPIPTYTPTSTYTYTPTITPIPTSTQTPLPTNTQVPLPTEVPQQGYSITLPDGVESNEHWIDVNLSQQAVYAYEGSWLVNSFIVSTGTWQHPTVTGTYRIYVKYRYADMAGPGYYLPDVPYVMYFYRGYGLHGTYWHHNFGTPMSHGCINFRTDDAGWLFNWSVVGTVVNIHY